MAQDSKTTSDKLSVATKLGFELVEIIKMRSTHRKFVFRYKGEQFFVTTSTSKSSDNRALTNFRQDLRLIKKAIDTDNQALRAKYLGAKR